MAFSREISFYTDKNKPVHQVFDPHWWNTKELMELHKFNFELNDGYEDYILEVDKTLLSNIHSQQLTHAKGFNNPLWGTKNKIEELNKLIAKADQFEKIEIKIFEWESGY